MSGVRGGGAWLLILVFGAARARAQPRAAEITLSCNDQSCGGWVIGNPERVKLCIDKAQIDRPAKGRAVAPTLIDKNKKKRTLVSDGARWCTTEDVDVAGTLTAGAWTRSLELAKAVLPEKPIAPASTWQLLDTSFDDSSLEIEYFSSKEPVEPAQPGTLPRIGLQLPRSDKLMWKQPIDVKVPRPDTTPVTKPTAVGEPVASTPGAGRPVAGGQVPSDAPASSPVVRRPPDDRSFADVVGVGDATGYHCTGILIGQRAVLTAAHCVPATRIGLGNDVHAFVATYDVTAASVHPELDVAVLRLGVSVPLVIRKRAAFSERDAPLGVLRMIGFGVDDPRTGGGFGIKRRIDVPVDGWGCDRGRARTSGCIVGAELVAAAVGGRDTCWGDSGGPVLMPADETFELVAITSRPVSRGGASCGRGGIYVRVDAVRAWLDQQIKESVE